MEDVSALQAFLRSSAGRGRRVLRAGPFTVTIHPHDRLKFVNYAIPDDGARPDAAAVAALRETFRSNDRLPRVEWIEEAAPGVAAALAAAGMEEELRTPLMACTEPELVRTDAAVDGLVVRAVGDADLRDIARVQLAAFGEPLPAADEPAPDPRRNGGGAVLARAGAEAVAAAAWTAVIDGCSEVAGVATAEPWRRRGLAGVVTAAAARAAFAAGAELCVLSPGDDGAQRVYARAGFRRAATMLHWSDPE
jgi:ribosomal protein S18 acetylase RimI-like enzyme